MHGGVNGGVNLAYLTRRGEIFGSINYQIEELLEKGLNEKDAFAFVNMALYMAISKNEWEKAEETLEKLSDEDVSNVLSWWNELFNKGDLEGLLLLVWFERLGFIEKSLLEAPEMHKNSLKEYYKCFPDWILEVKK